MSREYIRIWELNYPFRPQKDHQKFPKRHLVEVFNLSHGLDEFLIIFFANTLGKLRSIS